MNIQNKMHRNLLGATRALGDRQPILFTFKYIYEEGFVFQLRKWLSCVWIFSEE